MRGQRSARKRPGSCPPCPFPRNCVFRSSGNSVAGRPSGGSPFRQALLICRGNDSLHELISSVQPGVPAAHAPASVIVWLLLGMCQRHLRAIYRQATGCHCARTALLFMDDMRERDRTLTTKTPKPGRATAVLLMSIGGGALAIALSAAMTLVPSMVLCAGLNPEAAMRAEWAAAVVGIVWAGMIIRRAGRSVCLGAGIVVGLAWAITWLYLMGRFDPHLWFAEALPGLSWSLVLAWAAAPVLSVLGGVLAERFAPLGRTRRAAVQAVMPGLVLLVAVTNVHFADSCGTRPLGKGASVTAYVPERDGTIVRLLTFDFVAAPDLRIGLYDCDSDDAHPFDDSNTTYLGIPALSVFERRSPRSLCVTNAGFFAWTEKGRIGRHVAPVVVNGRAHYSRLNAPQRWTFGWKTSNGRPLFRLLQATPSEKLASLFDNALGHVRPLVVNGEALKLGPGAGVTTMKCSRTSLGWSSDSSRLYLLIIRDPDGERASIDAWKNRRKQVGGWDLLQVQRFWLKVGVPQALALDGGDSTQLVFRSPVGTECVGSARFSRTLAYLRSRPVRVWIPILPLRHSDTGVMNYIRIERE